MIHKKKICLTGIKPTGTPHLGNYFGAIETALKHQKNYDCRYFIADYHALNSVKIAKSSSLQEDTYQVAATWLACGLNPDQVIFYRQSSICEIAELTIILMNFTAKGLMNRAHAYKAAINENEKKGADLDKAINMGLFNYPIMMAADILLFRSNLVPIGKDQVQHLEITADIAQHFNGVTKSDFLVIPKPLLKEDNLTIIGTDGRKMSKSYRNTIALFSSAEEITKKVMKIPTSSKSIEEPKDPNDCNVFSLYKKVAKQEDVAALAKRYEAGGLSFGEAKQLLAKAIIEKFHPMKKTYDDILADKKKIDHILLQGEEKARAIARENLNEVKKIIGIKH